MRIPISLKIEEKLRKGLTCLSDRDGHSLTYHLERALTNYLKSKQIIKEKGDETLA